jgi:Mg-chelatase subunit ChlD
MYVMGDGKNLDYNIETQIMFVIDNSGSMYTKEQALKKDPTVDVDGLANDSEYKRLEITKKLINNLNGNYKFGVGKFTFSYTTLSELTNDRDKLKDTIDSIKTGKEGFDGTYIGEALYKSLDEFDSVGKIKKYIVLLTDGDDIIDIYGYDSKKMGKAINKALNLGVKIITIGLGDKVNERQDITKSRFFLWSS